MGGLRPVASVPGVAYWFPIAGPPTEKFAVRYAPAHLSVLYLESFAGTFQCSELSGGPNYVPISPLVYQI